MHRFGCLILGIAVLVLLPLPVLAQETSQISGQVVDAETGATLPGVNVFLDETTRGAATDEEGRFTIDGIEPGTYRLVASMIGYAVEEEDITLAEGALHEITIELTPDRVELEGVSVTADPSEWRRQLRRFERSFLGEVSNAGHTELVNPEVLHFETDSRSGDLVARSEEPLEMRNEALGYRVVFHVEKIQIGDDGLQTDLHGQFHELGTRDERQARRWQQAREEAYRGSLMHFVRSLSTDRLREEGFRVHLVNRLVFDTESRDQRRGRDVGQEVRSADEITGSSGSEAELTLTFRHPFLRIEHTRSQEERRYVRQYRPSGATSPNQLSWIELPMGRAVLDSESGQGRPPLVPALHGYWYWSERAPNMLPRDYRYGDPVPVAGDEPVARRFDTERVGEPAEMARRLQEQLSDRSYRGAASSPASALRLYRELSARGNDEAAHRALRRGVDAMERRVGIDVELTDAFIRSTFRHREEQDYNRAAALYLQLLEAGPELTGKDELAIFARHALQMSFLMQDEISVEGDEPEPADGPELAGWWRREDPDPASDDHPRLVEHLERVMEAEERFSARRDEAGFDDRGRIFVRYGEPSRTTQLQSLYLERSTSHHAAEMPRNEYWIYHHLGADAQFIFAESDGTYRLGGMMDLLPRSLQNRPQMPYFALVGLRDLYQQAVRFNADYGPALGAIESEYQEWIRVLEEIYEDEPQDVQELVGNQGFLDYDSFDPTFRQVWNMPATLGRTHHTDERIAERRDAALSPIHSEVEEDALPLPLALRTARFLDEDGTTRTEIYWAPEPGALDPAGPLADEAVRQAAARNFVLESTLVHYDADYARLRTDTERLGVGPEATAPDATIPTQHFQARGEDDVFHLALQLDQHFAATDGEAVGPAHKRGVVRLDSLRALDGSGEALELSDLRPLLLPEDDELVFEIMDHPGERSRQLAYPFERLPSGTPLALYFEVYHLLFDDDDMTRYELEYEIERYTEQGWVRTLLSGRDEQRTGASFHREETSRNVDEFIVIDLDEIEVEEESRLRITVRVTDEVSGETRERSLEFETFTPDA